MTDTETNSLKITSFRWDARQSAIGEVPYIIANITWRIDRKTFWGESLWTQMKAKSENYVQVTTTGTPEEEEAIMEAAWRDEGDGGDNIGGWIEYLRVNNRWGKAWTHQDATWQYIEKFDTFWLREWVTDCGVVRELLKELNHFYKTGKTLYTHRGVDDGVIMLHLETLNRYWD